MRESAHVRLVKKAKKGDAQAFIQLCEMYQVVTYNAAYKLLKNNQDVIDCLQETEIRAWKQIRKLRKEETFNSWLFRIMINCAKDILKKRIETIQLEESYWVTEKQTIDTIELKEVFTELPDRYKIPLILHYYSGFNIREIAQQLDMPENTVKTRLARGRQRLKILLEGE